MSARSQPYGSDVGHHFVGLTQHLTPTEGRGKLRWLRGGIAAGSCAAPDNPLPAALGEGLLRLRRTRVRIPPPPRAVRLHSCRSERCWRCTDASQDTAGHKKTRIRVLDGCETALPAPVHYVGRSAGTPGARGRPGCPFRVRPPPSSEARPRCWPLPPQPLRPGGRPSPSPGPHSPQALQPEQTRCRNRRPSTSGSASPLPTTTPRRARKPGPRRGRRPGSEHRARSAPSRVGGGSRSPRCGVTSTSWVASSGAPCAIAANAPMTT